jgi:dienelactone hydrolase
VAGRITAPILIQQGSRDRIVPREQAQRFHRALLDAGHAEAELLEYPLLGHAFWGWTADYHTPEEMAEAEVAWNDFTAFLARHLAPS